MGQQFVLEGDEGGSNGRAAASSVPQAVDDGGDDAKIIAQWRKEIAGYLVEAKQLAEEDPDDAMRWMAAISARACEIRDRSWDIKSHRAGQLRSRHIDPFVEEIDRQFKIASRRVEITRQELNMTRGMT